MKKSGCSRRKNSKKRQRTVGFFFLLIGLLVLLFQADGVIRSVIRGYPMSVATGLMLEKMDQSMSHILSNEGQYLSNIDRVQYGKDGSVLAVETDTADLNRIKAEFSSELEKILRQQGDTIPIKVPIGTLIGNEYTLGRGPEIRFDLRYSWAVTTELNSTFYEAGINNSLHSIELNVKNKLFILIPWGNLTEEISTKYILAETVIIGKIPNAYTGVYDGSGDIEDDIFNHQAE